MTCGGVRDVSRETLGWEVFGHRKPVSELGVNLTMNYWGKRNPDHLVLNLCHFWGSWSASGYVLNLYFFLTFFLSYRKLFFYTNVRGSYWSSHTQSIILLYGAAQKKLLAKLKKYFIKNIRLFFKFPKIIFLQVGAKKMGGLIYTANLQKDVGAKLN